MRRLFAQLAAGLAVVLLAMPALADDGQIAKQIIAQLKQQKQAANLKGFDLGVQVDNGTVTMMGQVATPEQAMLALDTARRIPGVKLVVNDLLVNARPAKQAATAPIVRQPVQRPVQPVQQVQMTQQTAIRPVAAQQPVVAHYNATGAIGSAVPAPQRPVPFAPSMIQQTSAQSPVAPANYVMDGGSYGGEIVGGGYAGPAVADNPSAANARLAELCDCTQHTVLFLIRSSIPRLRGLTLARFIRTHKYRWGGVKCRWNGTMAGGTSTSPRSKQTSTA